ncbi:hypothetical protein AAE026_11285 [Bradyrhizobium sp. DN5]|uniref:hypothetical protein n=1 Tax=Bradyrhizobium sp. DN5 TaxID=3056950 RepID=UPI0035238822
MFSETPFTKHCKRSLAGHPLGRRQVWFRHELIAVADKQERRRSKADHQVQVMTVSLIALDEWHRPVSNALVPALLTRMSIGPIAASMREIPPRTASAQVTSKL